MPKSPLPENDFIPSILILANGIPLPDNYLVVSVKINQQLNKPTIAEIAFFDDTDFTISSSNTFDIHAIVEIKLGYNGETTTVFTGNVCGHKIMANDKQAMLTFICKEESAIPIIEKYPGYSELKLTYGADIIDMNVTFDGSFLKDNPSRHRGYVKFFGSEKAKINTTINLKNLGKQFNEPVFISGVEQFLENGNWLTTITVGVESELS